MCQEYTEDLCAIKRTNIPIINETVNDTKERVSVYAVIAIDLSKAFDGIVFDLLIA